MSLRESTASSPTDCSGLMYVGVPRVTPDSVIRFARSRPPPSSIA